VRTHHAPRVRVRRSHEACALPVAHSNHDFGTDLFGDRAPEDRDACLLRHMEIKQEEVRPRARAAPIGSHHRAQIEAILVDIEVDAAHMSAGEPARPCAVPARNARTPPRAALSFAYRETQRVPMTVQKDKVLPRCPAGGLLPP
jgi:hypothetical protein